MLKYCLRKWDENKNNLKKQWCVRYRITWSSKMEEKFFNKKRDAKRFYEEAKICCDQAALGRVEE